MKKIQDAMFEYGLQAPSTIIYDGSIHRFKNDGDNNKNSWYAAYDNGTFQSGVFGCWKMGIHENFCSIQESSLTNEQKQQYIKQQSQQKNLIKEAKKSQQNYSKEKSIELFDNATSENINSHHYLQNKGVKSYGLKLDMSTLLIPMYDTYGELWSLQKINNGGEKKFQKGGRVKGCFYPIGKPDGSLILCEGYATGASIYEATGEAVAICFSSSNIKEVAKELVAKYPNVKMIIAGDDDHNNERNSGLIAAIEAAKHIGATTVFPKFDLAYDGSCTDFNDLHRLYGINEVKKQIYKAINDSESAINRGSFVFYDSFYKSMKSLECEDKSLLFNGVCEYGLYEKHIKLPQHINNLFELIKPQLEANFRKRKNGKKGGRPIGS